MHQVEHFLDAVLVVFVISAVSKYTFLTFVEMVLQRGTGF